MKNEKRTNSRTVRPVLLLLLLLSVAGVLLLALLRTMCSWNGMTDQEREEATRLTEAKAQKLVLNIAEIHSSSPVADAVARYLRETVAPNYGGEWEHCVPFVRIVATDASDPSDVRAWGEFRVFNYRLEDDTFHFVSGGNHPGLMHLRETDGALSVVSFDPILDGSEYTPSAKRIFGKQYKAWMALVADDESLEAARLRDLADYAALNDLPAKFAKDYGWDPVPLPPAASRGERGAPAPSPAPHRPDAPVSN